VETLYDFFFFQAEDGIRDWSVTGVQTCALPIWVSPSTTATSRRPSAAPTVRRKRAPSRTRTETGRWRGILGRVPQAALPTLGAEIGRASCRERVWSSGGGVTCKTKEKRGRREEK